MVCKYLLKMSFWLFLDEQYVQQRGPRNVRYIAVFFNSGQLEVNKSNLDRWTELTTANEAALTLFTLFQPIQH